MQNLPITNIFRLKFSSLIILFSHRRLSLLVAILLLFISLSTTWAQVITTPSTSATTPTSTQSSQGNTISTGVNTSTLPANIQQQINQQKGASGGVNSQTGDQTNADPNNPDQAKDSNDTQDNGTTDDANNDVKSQEEKAQELARQKVFGYSIFNDSKLKSSFQPNTNMATPRNYIIGPGDKLNIRLFGYSEADYSQVVSPEGSIYVAKGSGIGPIHVSGLTIEDAKARLTSRLSAKYAGLQNSTYGPKNTYLELSLGETRTIRVTVTGEATRPGTYAMSSLSTAMNAIYQAGGPNGIGSYRKVQLIRNNRIISTLDLYNYLLDGNQGKSDLRLQDNDNIHFTTFEEQVEIAGTVKRNNIFELLPGETLERLLFYAGNFTANAYRGRLKVRRVTERELKVIDVTTPEFKSFVMQDGDLVTSEAILDRFENKITIEGAVYRPGEYSLDNNQTLKKLITSAEGLKGDAFTGRINIVRTREDLAIENIPVNLDAILAGTEPDLPLQREDQVIVTSRFDMAEKASISIKGEVNVPIEEMPYMANMTLNDAILKTGGLKESAAASQVEVIRRKRDVDPTSKTAKLAEVFHFNVNRDLSLNADDNKFLLQPFDQIMIRRSPNYMVQTFAGVEGEVITPGEFPIVAKDMRVSDLLKMAGGISPYAYVEGATLLRAVTLSEDEIMRKKAVIDEIADNGTKSVVETETESPEKLETIDINLKKILANPGSSEDILVMEHDVLRIPKLLETVRVQGEVQLPKTLKYRSGNSFQDYIGEAGGFTNKSQRKRAFVVYANGSADRTRKFLFFNVYPRVEPGSEVVVPRRTNTPLTPQQLLSSTAGTISSLLSVIGLIIALSRVGN